MSERFKACEEYCSETHECSTYSVGTLIIIIIIIIVIIIIIIIIIIHRSGGE